MNHSDALVKIHHRGFKVSKLKNQPHNDRSDLDGTLKKIESESNTSKRSLALHSQASFAMRL
jgi:hypothetical protein